MRFDFDDIDAARQAVAGLDPADQEQFWTYIQKALRDDTAGAALFMGASVHLVECDAGPEGVILPLGPIGTEHRAILEKATREGLFAPRGTILDEVLFLYCGPEIGRGRLYITPIDAMHRYLQQLFSAAELTAAERNLACDLLVGFELRQTAERDSVSYETKRTILKRALSKTGLNSQSQLASRFLSSFLIDCHDAFQSSRHETTSAEFRTWAKTYQPTSIRIHTVLDDEDVPHHMLDMGPADGDPVVAFMPTVFPILLESYVTKIEALRLRVVMPLRHGAFSSNDHGHSAQRHLQETMKGFSCAKQLLGAEPTLVGFSNACAFAIAASQRTPSEETKIILVSPLFLPDGTGNPLQSFRQSFVKLAGKAPRLRALTLKFLRHKIATPDAYSNFLLKLASKNHSEQAVIEREFSDPLIREGYHEFALNSFGLFLADNHPDIALSPKTLTSHGHGLTILRGKEDTITTANHIERLMKVCPEAAYQTIDGAGHIMRFEAFETCFERIRNAIDQ